VIRIAVDAMGGDRGPEEIVAGALAARTDEVVPVLVGPPGLASEGLELIEASDVIAMDDKPAEAVRAKPDSSLVVACRSVREGRADAVVSAGNTGAMLAACLLEIRRLRGVRRPAIAVTIPSRERVSVLLDAGANADARPEDLLQFAHMGAVFAEEILDVRNPEIRLLSIGEEAEKGNQLTLERPELHRQHRGARSPARRRRRRRHGRLHRQRHAEAARGDDPEPARRLSRGDHRNGPGPPRRPADPPGGAPSSRPARPRHLRRRVPARAARPRRHRARKFVAARDRECDRARRAGCCQRRHRPSRAAGRGHRVRVRPFYDPDPHVR
jgi:fatty acid synthesis protein